jgi:YebC/PmpR family DNA-binding regulatory protein
MGRVFEKRKHKMFARYAKMAKAFTRIGREIVIAVKAGGPNPDSNSHLRTVIQNAKSINMPKDRIDGAIKRATEKDSANYEEVLYEGYAPHGVPVIIETATDNPTRTVANVRMYFSRGNGTLGTIGSVSFMFERKALFKISAQGLDKDNIELELIDFGAEELTWDDETNDLIIQVAFTDFGTMQKGLEDKGYEIKESSKVFMPTTTKEITEEQEADVMALIEKMEEDDDILAIYHNIA